MIQLTRNEMKKLMGGKVESSGSANCGSGTVTLTNCSGTLTCVDGHGCQCQGSNNTLTKRCPGYTGTI